MIFNTDPFVQTIRQDFSKNDQGVGFRIVQMILGTSKFAVVTTGLRRQKIMIWHDYDLVRQVNEVLCFHSEVKSVRVRPDRVVAVMMQKVFVYDHKNLQLLHEIETGPNPKGLCEISMSGGMVLVCLGSEKGEVRVEHYGLSSSKLIKAHDSDVACVALSNDGRLLATASTKGTLVRVFDTLDGRLLQELRRGSERAEVHSLSFSSDTEWLAVSSNKGTVHVFSLKTSSRSIGTDGSQEAEQNNSPLSCLSSFKGILSNYFSSEWSVARFHVPQDIQHIVTFGHQKHTVLIIGMNGIFYRCKFDPIAGGGDDSNGMPQLPSARFCRQFIGF
ncbi:UNVERIFIED_CONTAM: Autophagy-related protein 18a [Sesamum calycinum]|uniref:Autophagy-related protein 18a n=1 Tax=Sesamum calycinum TaxID=2727403 RepID=A0AAW2R8E5_9LAMI